MSKTKKLGIVAAIVAGVILASLLLLILFFPTDLIRDRAVSAMEEKLGRPVHVGGARLTLFPSLGADLTDVRVGERAEPGRPRFALASLRLRVRLLPLLHREVEITRVEIERLDVEIMLAGAASAAASPRGGATRGGVPPASAEPRLPASSVGGTTGSAGGPRTEGNADTAHAGPTPGQTRPIHFKIDELTLHDGSVRVRNADGTPFIDIGGVSEDLKAEATASGDISLAGHTLIDSLRVHLPAGDLGQGLTLRLDKVIRYDRSSDSLTIETADLDLNGLPVSVRGKAASVSSGHPTLDMSLQGGPAEVSDILGYLPSAVFPEMEGVQSKGTVAIQGSISGPLGDGSGPHPPGRKLDFRLAIALSDGRIVHPKLPAPVEQVNLHATFTPQSIDVTDFAAASGTNRIKARVKISDYRKAPSVDAALDADLDLHEVAAMHPSAGGYQVQGRAAAQLAVRGPAKDPNRLEVAGIIDLGSVRIQGPGLESPVENLNGRILVQDKDLTLQGLSAKMGSSDISARGTLMGYRALQPGAGAETPAKINLIAHSGLLALDELIPPSETKQAKPGDSAERLVSPAEKTAASLAALTGTIDFSADRIRTAETETGAARALVTFDRGLIHIERLDVAAFGGDIAVQGTVDYRRPQNPQFDLKAQVQKARASDLLASSKSLSRFSSMAKFIVGEMDASATLKGDLNETQDLNLGTFTSIGDLAIHGGEIVNHPLQVRIADFLEAPQLKTLAISDWYEPFRIEGGRLIVDGLSIKSKQIELSASGWQSVDGKVEMAFDILLPQELSGGIRKQIPKELVPVLFDSAGARVLVPLTVTGSYDAPRVAIDSERLTSEARAQAQKKLAADRQRLEEEARRRGQSLLDDLMKTPSDTTANAKKVNEVEKQIKDSLKNLFKKK